MSETLTIEAKIVQRHSPAIRETYRHLGLLDERGRRVHTAGARYAKIHSTAFGDFNKAARNASDQIKKVIAPFLTALGIGTITAGAGLALLTKSIIDFGDTAQRLKQLRQETGLPENNLRQYEALAPFIGSTAEKMDAGFVEARKQWDIFRRWRVGQIQEWAVKLHNMPGMGGTSAAELKAFAERYRQAKDMASAMQEVFAIMDRISSDPERREFLSTLGYDPNLARLTAEQRKRYLDMIKDDMRDLSPAELAAGLFEKEARIRLQNAWRDFYEHIGAEMAPVFGIIETGLREFLLVHGEEIQTALHDLAIAMKEFDWAGTFGQIKKIYLAIGGWKTLLAGWLTIEAIQGLVSLVLTARPWLRLLPWFTELAALYALYKTVEPQPLNEGEDERARQEHPLSPEEQKKLQDELEATKKKYGKPGVFDKYIPNWMRRSPFNDPELDRPKNFKTLGYAPAVWHDVKGSAMDIPGMAEHLGGGGEDIVARGVARGIYQPVYKAFVDASHYLRDEAKGFLQNAAYHPGGEAGEGGLGGGYGGLGGGRGAGLPDRIERPAGEASHPARTAILGGRVRQYAKEQREARRSGSISNIRIPLTGGAATRPNSISGLQPEFREKLGAMFAHAPPGSSVFSGYRSRALQTQLYNAPHRPGYVARPGHSHHETGEAADLHGNIAWFHKHAHEYGLRFPMTREPWHIENNSHVRIARQQTADYSKILPPPGEPTKGIADHPGAPKGGLSTIVDNSINPRNPWNVASGGFGGNIKGSFADIGKQDFQTGVGPREDWFHKFMRTPLHGHSRDDLYNAPLSGTGPGGSQHDLRQWEHFRVARAEAKPSRKLPEFHLLQTALRAGIFDDQPLGGGMIKPEASVRVDIEGLPRGARTRTRMSGAFKKIAVGRGLQTSWPEQEQA